MNNPNPKRFRYYILECFGILSFAILHYMWCGKAAGSCDSRYIHRGINNLMDQVYAGKTPYVVWYVSVIVLLLIGLYPSNKARALNDPVQTPCFFCDIAGYFALGLIACIAVGIYFIFFK